MEYFFADIGFFNIFNPKGRDLNQKKLKRDNEG